jgi:hypothetical protein
VGGGVGVGVVGVGVVVVEPVVTVVIAVAVSFLVSESLLVVPTDAIVAVLEILPVVAEATCTTSVKVETPPVARFVFVAVMVPVFAADVSTVQSLVPLAGANETNVVPVGSVSVSFALVTPEPELVTVMV